MLVLLFLVPFRTSLVCDSRSDLRVARDDQRMRLQHLAISSKSQLLHSKPFPSLKTAPCFVKPCSGVARSVTALCGLQLRV